MPWRRRSSAVTPGPSTSFPSTCVRHVPHDGERSFKNARTMPWALHVASAPSAPFTNCGVTSAPASVTTRARPSRTSAAVVASIEAGGRGVPRPPCSSGQNGTGSRPCAASSRASGPSEHVRASWRQCWPRRQALTRTRSRGAGSDIRRRIVALFATGPIGRASGGTMRTRSILVTLACALAGRARADVLVVGPAPAFPSIQAAVNAAQDGDVVLVKGGTWPSFSIVDRALAIVADDGAVVNVSGAILVANLAATRDVVLSGLRATGMLAVFPQNVYGLHASNCAGSLRVQDCELRGGPALPYDYCALRPDGALVQSCQDVVFTRTVLEGVDYTTLNVPPGLGSQRGGGQGLFAHSSRVALYGCALAGGYGFLDVLTCS